MSKVTVTASRTYDVLINEYTIDEVGLVVKDVIICDKALIITDSNVGPLYAARVGASLENVGIDYDIYEILAGEQYKTLETYGNCILACAHAHLTRNSVVIALGGGVVGDIAGFVAATYMRGCACVQVPTSLLACVDSSVGGKTAVDLPQGKNLVGAFFQPHAVVVDTQVFETLPQHFFTDGMAEVIKYGAIADADLFENLKQQVTYNDTRLEGIIARCVDIKRDIVQADERETGVRKCLNFGHTLGHALEKASNFSVTHGFAVALGMLGMARAAQVMEHADDTIVEQLYTLLGKYGFDMNANIDDETLYEASLSDKKRSGENLDVVCLRSLGDAYIKPIQVEDFKQWVVAAEITKG